MDTAIEPQYRTKDGSALRMWRDALQNNFLSEKFNRPIFDEVILVEVISPGSRDSSPVFELKRIYAPEMGIPEPSLGPKYLELEEYVKAFERGEIDGMHAGTPLSEWNAVSKSFAASLRAASIFTVEGLANLPDTRLVVVGPDGRQWRDKAAAYLESTKGEGHAVALAAENGVLRADKAQQAEQIKLLADKLDALEKAEPDNTALNAANARIAELEAELTAAKAEIAKFDHDKNGKAGGSKPAAKPADPLATTPAAPSII